MSNVKSNMLRYFQFGIVVLAAGAIYPLIYLRAQYQDTILQVFNMSVEELSGMYVMLGLMFTFGYIPSGWLADRLSPKLLLAFSLGATGVLGIVFAQVPDPSIVRFIFIGWGISAVFTFWGSHLKCTKMLATEGNQAKYFGILDGGRGVVEAVLGSIVLAIFAMVAGGVNENAETTRAGLITVIYVYAVLCLIVSALIVIFLKSDTYDIPEEEKKAAQEGNFASRLVRDIKDITTRPRAWVMALIIFCGYAFYWSVFYYSGFLTTNYGVTATTAAAVTTAVLWMRPIGGFLGGIFADKIGRPNMLIIALIVGAVLTAVMAIFPSGGSLTPLYALVVLAGLTTYFVRGLYWSLLDDCRFPVHILGFGIGFISFLGYLVDVVIPKVTGPVFTAYNDGPPAYVFYMLMSAGFAVACLLLNFVFRAMTAKDKRTEE